MRNVRELVLALGLVVIVTNVRGTDTTCASEIAFSVVPVVQSALEEDFPAAARGPDGTLWLCYLGYQLAQPIDRRAIQQHRFDSLVARGNGDRLLLSWSTDGRKWAAPVAVVTGLRDIWRPTIAVTSAGDVVVLWSEQVEGNWELFARVFWHGEQPPGVRGTVRRLTHAPGPDVSVVATAVGNDVWLAWQAWNGHDFDIRAGVLSVANRQRRCTFRTIPVPGNSPRNEWSPALVADARRRVWLAWDTYAAGNYDVRLVTLNGSTPDVITVAGSARFEARPALAVDSRGRLWVAYEVGDEQWGKDFTLPASWGRNRGEVDPGRGLYLNRHIELRCVDGGKLYSIEHQPRSVLATSFGDQPAGRWSLPRLAADPAGGLWLTFRRHPRPNAIGGGEVWHSYATYYTGQSWSQPVRLDESAFLIDSRPALVPLASGRLCMVFTGDRRHATQRRENCDLYAALLEADLPRRAPSLQPAHDPQAQLPPVHPSEQDDLEKVRAWRLQVGEQTLRLYRGEFHRHTELTAHRDGDGLLEDMWRYALDAAQLDWVGNGDHDNGFGVEYHWWQVQKTTDIFYLPPRFVSVYSYERSNPWPNGHRNVILPIRGIRPLPRGQLQGSPAAGSPDTKMLYAYLHRFGGICAAHTSATGMGTDWRDNDPVVEPIVEIFQGCRQPFQSYEHLGAPRAAPRNHRFVAGYVWNALKKGYRLGFQCSSDHFSTHISYAFVLASRCSRSSILEAFRRRHCYGANDVIILSVRCGEHIMGDEFIWHGAPQIDIEVHGTRPLRAVRVIRNNEYVYVAEPGTADVKLQFTDGNAQPGKEYYYYVRVEQDNGTLAWSSPMWIHVRAGSFPRTP